MNSLGRRALLLGSLIAALAGWSRGVLAAVVGPAPREPLAALPAWLDTLIPADDTPAASALGVDRALIELARQRASTMRLLTAGCGWLDDQARRRGANDFASAPAATRDAIAAAAEAAPERSLPKVFFANTQTRAFFLYYGKAAAWPGLGYDGPPQPEGFPDHDRPPA